MKLTVEASPIYCSLFFNYIVKEAIWIFTFNILKQTAAIFDANKTSLHIQYLVWSV